MPLTRERLLALRGQVVARTDLVCLERQQRVVAGVYARDVHARMVRDLIALRVQDLRLQELVTPDAVRGQRDQRGCAKRALT
jgi:hypothetical protein